MTVAWISQFPVEWLDDVPDSVKGLPREHPLSWQRVLLQELEGRSDLRLHIVVLRKQIAQSFSFERRGVFFHLIKVPGFVRAPSLFWLDTVLIRRKLAEINPDLVHAWGSERGAALVASRLKYPYVVTVQGLLSWINERVRLPRYHQFSALLEKWSLPRAPVITTEAAFAVEYLKKRFGCRDVRQIEHAPDWIYQRVQRQPPGRVIRLVFVGTLSRAKGVDLLLKTVDRLKAEFPFEVVIIGNRGMKFLAEMKRKVSAEIWELVRFRYDLTPGEIAEDLSTATLMVFPSRADTSPNAVKEAVVAGVPVIASNVGGIPDYVLPGRNGLLFTTGDLEDCIRAVREGCRHSLFGCGQVEPAALEWARDYLSPKRMGERFMGIYQAHGD